METKKFEQIMHEIFEEIKNYSANKDDNEAREEGETLLVLGTNNKMNTSLSIKRGTRYSQSKLIAEAMTYDDEFKDIVIKAFMIYYLNKKL